MMTHRPRRKLRTSARRSRWAEILAVGPLAVSSAWILGSRSWAAGQRSIHPQCKGTAELDLYAIPGRDRAAFLRHRLEDFCQERFTARRSRHASGKCRGSRSHRRTARHGFANRVRPGADRRAVIGVRDRAFALLSDGLKCDRQGSTTGGRAVRWYRTSRARQSRGHRGLHQDAKPRSREGRSRSRAARSQVAGLRMDRFEKSDGHDVTQVRRGARRRAILQAGRPSCPDRPHREGQGDQFHGAPGRCGKLSPARRREEPRARVSPSWTPPNENGVLPGPHGSGGRPTSESRSCGRRSRIRRCQTVRSRFPDRFVNAGVAEQKHDWAGDGRLPLSGRVVFTYSIANFPTAVSGTDP